MIENYKSAIANQINASLQMLGAAIQGCDEERWHEPVAKMSFAQLAFHTLFYTDLYLGPNIDAMKAQAFHQEYASSFGDYEELANQPQTTRYERNFIDAYLPFVAEKAQQAIQRETPETLEQPADFPWLKMNRFELHPYNIRHINYHVGQFSLLGLQEKNQSLAWVK